MAYIKETIRHANGLLQNFSIFVFSGGKFVLLPDEERGHFWNGDAYVFLCVYKMEQEQERQNRENDNNELLKKDTLVAKDEGSVTALKSSNDGEEVVDDDCDNEEEEGEEEMDNGSMECVVYFWQGRLAHRLAISTFKFKTQAEMERLMQDLYGCPVKVVYLDPGKEPIALLAHLNNTFILHSGSRKEFAQRMDSLILSDSQHQEEDEYIENQQLSSGQSRIATTAAATVAAIEKTLTYQIWTDLRYRTIRATQVQSQTSSLVSKNCFLCFTTDFNKVFIWVGKHTSREDAANAQACSHKILSIWGHPDLVGRSALIPEYTPRVSLHNRLSTGGISSEASSVRIIVIDEKAETRSFWSLFGLESSPPPARHPIPISSSSSSSKNVSSPSLQATLATTTTTAAPPESFTPSLARFLRCHCSEGYFLVEEIVHFNQCDLRRDSCIILDPGCWSPCYIWAGSESSDVVRKLTRKSVEVWFSNLADGRGLGAISAIAGEKSAPKPKFGPIRNNVYSEGDVVWISEGFETRLFCSLFQGWDSAIRAY